MSAPIASDPSQWFDGLRPEKPFQLPDLGATAPPEEVEYRVDHYGQVPSASEVLKQIGHSGGPFPIFGENQED